MEDNLSVQHIKSILEGQPMDFNNIYEHLLETGAGQDFFDPNRDWMPQTDFELCLRLNRFEIILRVEKSKSGLTYLKRIV